MTEKSSVLLIAGLGNPGPEYAKTRHNAGFIVVDFLAGVDAVWKKERNYLVANDKANGVIFIKPTTFMNLSGLAIQSAMTKYKIPLSNITVIHDDIDLKLGDVRVKTGGGNAGHNGLKSIDATVGKEYRRIRLGVGRPENKDYEISDWVLGKLGKSELKEILNAIKSITKN